MSGLENRVALVTGGASGIGRACALALAAQGAKVVVADVDEKRAEETAHFARSSGGEAWWVRCDVTRAEDVQAAVEAAAGRYGRLDLAVNNAGIEGMVARIADATVEDFDRVVSVNLRGVWLSLHHEIRQMLAQPSPGGRIVNVASVAGLVGWMGAGAYSACKHGVVGLTRTAALEYARRGIRVNAVCPGVIDTPMAQRMAEANPRLAESYLSRAPVARFGRPEEVAAVVTWLLADESSLMTGAAVPVDGAWTAQ